MTRTAHCVRSRPRCRLLRARKNNAAAISLSAICHGAAGHAAGGHEPARRGGKMHLRGPFRLRDGSTLRSAPTALYALQMHFPVKGSTSPRSRWFATAACVPRRGAVVVATRRRALPRRLTACGADQHVCDGWLGLATPMRKTLIAVSECCSPLVPRSCSRSHRRGGRRIQYAIFFFKKARTVIVAPPRTGNVEQEPVEPVRFFTNALVSTPLSDLRKRSTNDLFGAAVKSRTKRRGVRVPSGGDPAADTNHRERGDARRGRKAHLQRVRSVGSLDPAPIA